MSASGGTANLPLKELGCGGRLCMAKLSLCGVANRFSGANLDRIASGEIEIAGRPRVSTYNQRLCGSC